MESSKLFSDSTLSVRRRRKPLVRVFAIALLAPGFGHFLVGRARTAAVLLLAMLAVAFAAAAAALFELPGSAWLTARLGLILVLFAIIDATLLRVEENDGRSWGRRDRPRLAAALDLMIYGASPWRRGHKGLAVLAIVFGLVVHIFLGSQNLPLRLLSEALVGSWAFYSWRTAKEEAALQHVRVRTNFDQMLDREDDEEKTARPDKAPDRTPGWVMPTLAAVVATSLLGVTAMHAVATSVRESMEIDRSRVISMEPFFRNPNYGISLEMNAPGWTFLPPAGDQILVARHVSQQVSLHLAVRPRVPLLGDDRAAALSALAESMLSGALLAVVEEGPTTVGGQPGYHLRAEGRRGRNPVIAEIWSTGKQWREYILWIERDPRHDDFALTETAFLLDRLSIENGTPAVPSDATATAR